MTRKEKINQLNDIFAEINEDDNAVCYLTSEDNELIESAIEALEQQPYEKFESAKDHIYKLAGDYKCWDNRLTKDEAVELCHILEQEPCYNPDEWCKTCKEYDHDNHCCPRYNKVIRSAVEEIKEPCEDKIIEWKKDFKEYVNSLSMLNDDYKGIMEYIDELPVTSKQPCEDAISRADAINKVTNFYTNCERLKMFRHTSNEVKQTVTDILCDLPPVQPMPKMGHWVEYTRVLIPEPINRWEQAWYCSECGYGNQECEDGSAWLEWKYCPNCGARMVKPQESEEV